MKIFLVCIVSMLICWRPASAEESPLRSAGAMLKVAKIICSSVYGKTRPQVNQATLQHYCGRLQHPQSFLQDLEWWKQNAPALLQGPPAPEPPPFRETQYRACVSKGNPEILCMQCSRLPEPELRISSSCQRWGFH